MVRSADGWTAVRAMRKAGVLRKGDERILGSSEFILDVLACAKKALDEKYALSAQGVGFTDLVAAVSRLMSIAPEDLMGSSKARNFV